MGWPVVVEIILRELTPEYNSELLLRMMIRYEEFVRRLTNGQIEVIECSAPIRVPFMYEDENAD